jgi:DNA mismatch repair ATPase MutS
MMAIIIPKTKNVQHGDGKKGKQEEILNFPYRIQRGLNPDSSGIDIAKLVGLPKEVISHATTIKRQLGNYSLRFEQDHKA